MSLYIIISTRFSLHTMITSFNYTGFCIVCKMTQVQYYIQVKTQLPTTFIIMATVKILDSIIINITRSPS